MLSVLTVALSSARICPSHLPLVCLTAKGSCVKSAGDKFGPWDNVIRTIVSSSWRRLHQPTSTRFSRRWLWSWTGLGRKQWYTS